MPFIRDNEAQRKKGFHLRDRKQARKLQRKLKRGKQLSNFEESFLNKHNKTKNTGFRAKNHHKHHKNKSQSSKRPNRGNFNSNSNSNFYDKKNNNNWNEFDNINDDFEDADARLIKSLEKKLGVSGQSKYWKKQEFAGDGIDCFFDFGYFSNESDVDDNEKRII